jgi:hypothetical protein
MDDPCCLNGHTWPAGSPLSSETVNGAVVETFSLDALTCPECGLPAHEDGKDFLYLPPLAHRRPARPSVRRA